MASTTLDRRAARGGSPGPATRPRRRRRWLRWLIAFLVLALLGTAVWLLGFSSVFATQRVNVTGAKVLSTAQVRDAARIPLGLPLARQDLDAVAARVATLVPVESVTVDRAWPDQVDIRIAERTPVLAVQDPSGYRLIDRAGVAFDSAVQVPTGIVLAEAQLSDAALLVQIGIVARSLPEDVRTNVSRIKASSPTELMVVLDSGVSVNWGTADQSPLKAEIVTALLERKPRSIDVSSPHNPAIR